MKKILLAVCFITSWAHADGIFSTGSGGGGGITGVTAGLNLNGGGTSGTVTVNLAPGSTQYVQNNPSGTQAGAFSISSGSVHGTLRANALDLGIDTTPGLIWTPIAFYQTGSKVSEFGDSNISNDGGDSGGGFLWRDINDSNLLKLNRLTGQLYAFYNISAASATIRGPTQIASSTGYDAGHPAVLVVISTADTPSLIQMHRGANDHLLIRMTYGTDNGIINLYNNNAITTTLDANAASSFNGGTVNLNKGLTASTATITDATVSNNLTVTKNVTASTAVFNTWVNLPNNVQLYFGTSNNAYLQWNTTLGLLYGSLPANALGLLWSNNSRSRILADNNMTAAAGAALLEISNDDTNRPDFTAANWTGGTSGSGIFQDIYGDYFTGHHINIAAQADGAKGYVNGIHAPNAHGIFQVADSTNAVAQIIYQAGTGDPSQNLIDIRAATSWTTGNPSGSFSGKYINLVNASTTMFTVDSAGALYSATTITASSATLTNLSVGTLSTTGSGAGQWSATEGSTSTVTGVASGKDVMWADSVKHTFLFNPNNTSTYTVVGSSVVPVIGQMAVFTGTGTLIPATNSNSYSFTVVIGTATEGWNNNAIPIWQAPKDTAITITQVDATAFSVAASTLQFQLDERAFGSLNSAGTNVFSVAAASAPWTGASYSSFANAGIAARASLVLTTPTAAAEAGTVKDVSITVYYQKDTP